MLAVLSPKLALEASRVVAVRIYQPKAQEPLSVDIKTLDGTFCLECEGSAEEVLYEIVSRVNAAHAASVGEPFDRPGV